MNQRDAFKAIRAVGCTVSKTDGEYRVNLKGGNELTAYYTDSRSDAVDTARAMAQYVKQQ